MCTDWACSGHFDTFENIATVPTLPLDWLVFFEYLALCDALEQFQVASLVVCFNFGYGTKSCCDRWKAFLLGDITEVGV